MFGLRKSKKNLIIIDTETTGLSSRSDYIVEVAAVELDCKTLNYRPIFDSLCNPGLSEDELEATWICGNGFIPVNDVLSAPSDRVVASKLRSVIENDHWTAFNLDFDKGFLMRSPWNLDTNRNAPCIMKSATSVCKIPHTRFRYKYPKLDEASKMLLGKQSVNHRALDDAIMATEVLVYLIKNSHYRWNN